MYLKLKLYKNDLMLRLNLNTMSLIRKLINNMYIVGL